MRREESHTKQKKTFSKILSQTIKTGIIKSNLITMFAGLTLALYTYQISPFEKLIEIILTLIGSILVMGAAGAFNNLYDRDIDAIMQRTKNRPTVTGEIKPKTVFWLGILMSILGLVALALTTHLAAFLGFLGLFFILSHIQCGPREELFITQRSEVFLVLCHLLEDGLLFILTSHIQNLRE